MSNGGIIGPVVNPTRGDLTTTFTASGTYASPGFGPGTGTVLIVAGGGGGNQASGGGGGGAGGFRIATCSPIPVSPFSVTVGSGGAYSSTTGIAGSNG